MSRNAVVLLIGLALGGDPLHAQTRPDPEALITLLRASNYAELDARVGTYQQAYEASTDAEWALVVAVGAFARVEPELENHHDGWIAARPKSYVARLARGVYWHQRAWTSRGGRFSADTPKVRMEAMRRAFEQAAADLKASLVLGAQPQLSHRYLVVTAMARGDKSGAHDAYLAGLKADPQNYASRRAYLNALRPEWGGSVEAMSRIAVEAQQAAPSAKMREVAARLHASIIGYRALEAYRAKDYQRAFALYNEGLAGIEDSVLLENRGLVLERLERHDEAMRDFDRALALDPNSREALERRGNVHEQRKQVKQAVRDYALAASYGSTYAMRRLGIWYLNGGDGLPVSDVQALRWLRLGAEFGEDNAQMALGYMYAEARGVPQDARKAYDLWRLSAAQGNKEAQQYLDDIPWWSRARFAMEDLFGR